MAIYSLQCKIIGRGKQGGTVSHHDPHGNNSNPHVHVLLTMRSIKDGRFTWKNRDWNQKATLENWREAWAITCNDFLAEQRSSKDVAAAPMPIADGRQGVGQGRDSRGGDVQRRTYTSQGDVVRQGSNPAPKTEERDALRGDYKGAKPPLEEVQLEQKLAACTEQVDIAEALCKGVCSYFGVEYKSLDIEDKPNDRVLIEDLQAQILKLEGVNKTLTVGNAILTSKIAAAKAALE